MKVAKRKIENESVKVPNRSFWVTEEIIANSTPGSTTRCMIAEASRLAYPGIEGIDVSGGYIKFNQNGIRYVYELPAAVTELVQKYDDLHEQGLPVTSIKPFRVKLHANQGACAPSYKRKPQPGKKMPKKEPGAKKKPCVRRTTRRRHGIAISNKPADKSEG